MKAIYALEFILRLKQCYDGWSRWLRAVGMGGMGWRRTLADSPVHQENPPYLYWCCTPPVTPTPPPSPVRTHGRSSCRMQRSVAYRSESQMAASHPVICHDTRTPQYFIKKNHFPCSGALFSLFIKIAIRRNYNLSSPMFRKHNPLQPNWKSPHKDGVPTYACTRYKLYLYRARLKRDKRRIVIHTAKPSLKFKKHIASRV